MTAASSEASIDAAFDRLVAFYNHGRFADMESLARALVQQYPSVADFWKGLGVAQQMQGKDALAALQRTAQLSPRDAEAHSNLGNALRSSGRLAEAVASFQRALDIEPQLAEAHSNLGNAWRDLGKPADAEASYRRALQIKPGYVEAHNNLGGLLRELGKLEEAAASYRRALQLCPGLYEAERNLGNVLKELGQTNDALACFERALKIKPDFAEAHCDLGRALQALGRHGDAVAYHRRALQIRPGFAEAHCNLGSALKESGRPAEAVDCYHKALQIRSDYVEAHYNLGNALFELNRVAEAIDSYQCVLTLKPDLAEAHNNLGNALRDIGKIDAAAASYRRALELTPDSAETHHNLGNALADRGLLHEALASYRRALDIQPDFIEARSNVLFTHNFLADQSEKLLLAEARNYGEAVAHRAKPYTAWSNTAEPGRRLRIGLVSGDLRVHPVGYFIDSILAALAADASLGLELYAYPTRICGDALAERIKSRCHDWHSAVGLSDESLARRIHEDRIDILIDLAGHTAHNRLPMFAWKPAPVQASWLGYFATTGVGAIDYLVADPWSLPESEDGNFTETIWRLPQSRLCFTAPDEEVTVSPLPALKNDHVTFGCFNNLSKMNDAIVSLWASILHAVPHSRLFLKARQLNEPSVRERVFERFAAHGIEAGRLIVEGASPRAAYLADYGRVDIALDPFPYTGGATTAEALWMGVPVLTLAGQRFLSRQGVGLLMNAGLPDWIAADEADYLTLATAHAADLPRLAALRTGLRSQVQMSPLFDATGFAKHFAAALREMWERWCRGL